MSRQMSDPTRFDPLIRLLDLNDDKRMPLFFHELRKVNRTAQNTIKTPITEIDATAIPGAANYSHAFSGRTGSLTAEIDSLSQALASNIAISYNFNQATKDGNPDNLSNNRRRFLDYLAKAPRNGSVDDFAASLMEGTNPIIVLGYSTTTDNRRENFTKANGFTFIPSNLGALLTNTNRLATDGNVGKTTGFSLNVSKYYVSRLYNQISGQADQVVDNLQSFFSETGELLYTRTDDGKLIDGTGKEVGRNSQEFKDLKVNPNCFGTKITGASGSHEDAVCQDYIENCLLGKGIEDCKRFLTDNKYWGSLASEVRKMNPEIALASLKKFGFKSETDNSNGLVSVESVSDWSKNLNNTLNVNDAANIRKNAPLMGYLSAVVNVVNSSPDILNNRQVDVNVVQSTGLGKYGIPVKSTNSGNMSAATIVRLNNAVQSHNSSIAVAWGINNVQSGGGISQIDEIEKKYKNRPKYLSNELKNTYEGFKRRLLAHNKSIDDKDDKHVYKLISELADSERKLYKTMMFSEKYATLLELAPYTNQKNQQVLSYDKLKKFVDARNKYFLKTSKRQSTLLMIYEKFAEDIDKSTKIKGDL
jgi:hypothetical protein